MNGGYLYHQSFHRIYHKVLLSNMQLYICLIWCCNQSHRSSSRELSISHWINSFVVSMRSPSIRHRICCIYVAFGNVNSRSLPIRVVGGARPKHERSAFSERVAQESDKFHCVLFIVITLQFYIIHHNHHKHASCIVAVKQTNSKRFKTAVPIESAPPITFDAALMWSIISQLSYTLWKFLASVW